MTYRVDDAYSGFIADVEYKGQAKYAPAPAPYKPAPPPAPYKPAAPVVYRPAPAPYSPPSPSPPKYYKPYPASRFF